MPKPYYHERKKAPRYLSGMLLSAQFSLGIDDKLSGESSRPNEAGRLALLFKSLIKIYYLGILIRYIFE